MVRRGSVWCGVAQYGAAWLSMVRRGSVWCGVAQYGAAWLAVRQARVRFSARHHREGLTTELSSNEEMERGPSKWRWINVLYECEMNVCMKNMKNKQKEWHPVTKPLDLRIHLFTYTTPSCLFNYTIASLLHTVVITVRYGTSSQVPYLLAQLILFFFIL